MRKISLGESEIDLEYYEKNNIKFMLINPLAGNSESIKPIGKKYGLLNVLYHSKGLSSIFNIRVMPRLILISPDKKKYYEIDKDNISKSITQIINQ